MNLRSMFIALVLLIWLTSNALAADAKNEISLSLVAGGFFPDGDRHLGSSTLYGVKLGYALSGRTLPETLTVEGDLSLITSPSSEEKGRGYVARLDALYSLRNKGTLIPHLAIGAGFINPPGAVGDTFVAAYGAGAFYNLTPAVALRADVRHLLPMTTEHFNDFTASLGLTYVFGRKAEEAQKKVKDSDRDGVVDSRDRCSDTPVGLKVDRNGCPDNPPDGDRDGVADYMDRCLDTPAGAEVDASGCLKDSDGDGVSDSLDECPGNPPGLPVDQRGCVQLN